MWNANRAARQREAPPHGGDAMTVTTERAVEAADGPQKTMSLGWALKRVALAIVILSIAVGTVAWLTYSSIDPLLEIERTAAAGGA